MNRKKFAMIMTIVMVFSLVGCGENVSEVSTTNEVNNEVSTNKSVEPNVNASINASINTSVGDKVSADVNASTEPQVSINVSATTTSEKETDSRIGKTLGELMDLTAYEEEAETLDYYRDSSRELKDVLPFEIYEFIFDELINYYADESGEKTVKAASIEGTYGSVMIIKMDESDTFDMVMRATSDRFALSGSCIYSDLPDFKMILTNLTKEEVENMLYDNGELKAEYRYLVEEFEETATDEISGILETGKRLEEIIDLTAYQEILVEIEASDDYFRELKDILPFEIYTVEHDYGLCNLQNMDGTFKTVLSGSIPGEIDSVMVVKMDGASTYDILLRVPYEKNDYYGSCYFKDLGNYKVIASNLTKEEVERMVYPEQMLAPEYVDMIYDTWTNGDVRSILGEYLLREMREPRYFVFNPYTIAYEELTEENKGLLAESMTAYVYFGANPMPQANEDVTHVETYFNSSVEEMTLEEIIEKIKEWPISGTHPLVANPFDTSSY